MQCKVKMPTLLTSKVANSATKQCNNNVNVKVDGC